MMFKYLALVAVAVFAQDATTTPDSTATPVPISSETFKQRPGVCNAGGKECAAYGTGSDYQCVAVESTIPSLNNLAQCVKKGDQQGSNICVGSQAGVCPTFGSWPATYRAAQPVCAFTVVPTCTSAQTSNGNFVSVRELQSANTSTTKKPSGVECFLNNYLLANGSTTQIKGIYKCVDITFYRSKALGLDQTEKQLKACAGNSSTGFTAGLCNGHGTCSPKSQYSSEYECKCNRGYSNKDNCFAATENVCDGLGQCGGLGQCDSATNTCKCKDGAKGDQCALCDPASAAACSGSNQGSCGVDGKCVCKTGYGGSQCEVRSAPTPAPTTTPGPNQAGGSTPSGSASTVFASLAAVALAVVLA